MSFETGWNTVSYLTDASKAFVSNTSKVAGFLLASIGWLATSREARAYLSSAMPIAYLAAVAVLFTCALSTAASRIAFNACEQTYQNLLSLNYLPERAYEARRLKVSTFLVCVIGNGAISLLLAASLLLISSIHTS